MCIVVRVSVRVRVRGVGSIAYLLRRIRNDSGNVFLLLSGTLFNGCCTCTTDNRYRKGRRKERVIEAS